MLNSLIIIRVVDIFYYCHNFVVRMLINKKTFVLYGDIN